MKKLFLIILFFTIQSTIWAQDPDPQLFRSWNLKFVQLSDLVDAYEVAEIFPPINPYLIIEENFEYYGQGACNTFNGSFEFLYPEFMNTIEFSKTTDDCGFQIHNFFENDYFLWMEEGPGDYFITQDSNGLILTFYNPVFGAAIFQDYPLSTSDFESYDISLFPNPANSRLKIIGQTDSITQIEIITLLGQTKLTSNQYSDSIDVSSLPTGIYLMRIHTQSGITIKRFIKN